MSTVLAIRDDQTEFDDRQLAALAQLGVQDAAPADLALFFNQAQRTGLDPFSRQIYMIGRRSGGQVKQTIQVGIDGLRLVARRAADRAGETLSMEDTRWADASGQWHDLWLSPQPPAAAKVTVIRGGGRFSAVAMFSEYAQAYNGKLSGVWASKPALMIAKCAEALALRKAFPADLSNLYTDDEMSTAEPAPQATQRERIQDSNAQATAGLQANVNALLKEAGVSSRQEAGAALSHLIGHTVSGASELTVAQAREIINPRRLDATRQKIRDYLAEQAQKVEQAEQVIDVEVVQDELTDEEEAHV